MPQVRKPDTKMTRAEFVQQAAAIMAEADPGLRPLNLAILSTFTVDLMRPCLVVEGAAQGFRLDLWVAPFGQIEQQAFDAGSLLYQAKRDILLILPRIEDWLPEVVHGFAGMSPAGLAAAKETAVSRLAQVLEEVGRRTGAHLLLANFAPASWLAAGTADSSLACSQSSFIQSLNDALAGICARVPGACILDVARVATEVGLRHWTDERMAFLAKAPLSLEAMGALATAFARRLRSLTTTPKKCLVLDLDNTLWGGVLGEAGLEGIALGPDYPGNVFLEFQQRILALRDCGVLLAVASKNNEIDALAALDQHPSGLLRRHHFAALEIHWEDKATSLRRIAATLNIGIDALVFFDDNPSEREWVRAQLPEVTVIEAPPSPLGYARALADCGGFDFPRLVAEDARRADYYQQDTLRRELHTQATSLEEFLTGLGMTITAGNTDEAALPRIVQLLGKTNQFNLTTRRHTSADLQSMIAAGAQVLWFRVQDKFGDNGLVGIAIAVPSQEPGLWHLDSFLLSCRVIGRQVETAMLAVLEKVLHGREATALTAEFIPTAKNAPAAQFLPGHGFQEVPGGPWILPLAKPRTLPDYFRLEGIPSFL